jgi:hypothetical protein
MKLVVLFVLNAVVLSQLIAEFKSPGLIPLDRIDLPAALEFAWETKLEGDKLVFEVVGMLNGLSAKFAANLIYNRESIRVCN